MRRSGNRTYNRNTAADWKINSRHRRAFDKIAAGPLPLLSRYRALFIVRRYTSIPVPNRMSACSVFTPQYKSAIFHFRRNLRDIFEDAYFSAHESNRIGNFSRIYISFPPFSPIFGRTDHSRPSASRTVSIVISNGWNDRRRPREWKCCETLATFWEQKIHSHVGVTRLNKRRTVRHLSRRRPKASITCLQILPS